MEEKKKDLLDEMAERVSVDINGETFELRRYTVRVEIELRKVFKDMETWVKKFQEMDGETLCKTLFVLMKEPKWENWMDLADELPADAIAKAQIGAAVSACITSGMPEVREVIDEAVKKFQEEIKTSIKKQ